MNRLLLKYRRFAPVVACIMATAGCGMLTSCQEKPIPAYSEFIDVDPAMWFPGNPAEFSPWPRDSVADGRTFNLIFAVRYNSRTPDTLTVALTEESFESPTRNDTLVIPLRNSDSRPVGSGNFGIYTVSEPLRSTPPLPEGLRIAVEPTTPVPGIVSVGLILEPPAIIRDS